MKLGEIEARASEALPAGVYAIASPARNGWGQVMRSDWLAPLWVRVRVEVDIGADGVTTRLAPVETSRERPDDA